MNLDRALAEAEVRSHHLIRLATGHQGKHFPLARRQRVEPLANAGALTERRAILAIPLQRPLNAVDQILVPEGLLQEIKGSVLHGFDRHGDIAVSGDEDHGNHGAAQVELLLQLEAAHSRHAHVECQTTRLLRVIASQELLRGGEHSRSQANRFDEQPQRVSHCGVVIHDEYGRR